MQDAVAIEEGQFDDALEDVTSPTPVDGRAQAGLRFIDEENALEWSSESDEDELDEFAVEEDDIEAAAFDQLRAEDEAYLENLVNEVNDISDRLPWRVVNATQKWHHYVRSVFASRIVAGIGHGVGVLAGRRKYVSIDSKLVVLARRRIRVTLVNDVLTGHRMWVSAGLRGVALTD